MADILTPDVQIPDSASRTPDDLPGKTPAPAEDTSASESEDSHTESHEETESEEESASSDEKNEEDAGDESTDAQPTKKPKGVQKRIDELTRQRYEAENRADAEAKEKEYWRRQAEEKQQAQQQNSDKEPRFEDFESYDDYVKAVVKHERSNERKLEKQQEETQKQQVQQQQIQESFNSQAESAKKKYSDFEQVAFGKHVAYSAVSSQLVAASESGAELAYYLGLNPEIAKNIAHMNPIDAAKAIGRLEAKLTESPKPKPKNITAAPPPVKTVGGNERVKKDPSKMSMTEYIDYRRSGNKSRR